MDIPALALELEDDRYDADVRAGSTGNILRLLRETNLRVTRRRWSILAD